MENGANFSLICTEEEIKIRVEENNKNKEISITILMLIASQSSIP